MNKSPLVNTSDRNFILNLSEDETLYMNNLKQSLHLNPNCFITTCSTKYRRIIHIVAQSMGLYSKRNCERLTIKRNVMVCRKCIHKPELRRDPELVYFCCICIQPYLVTLKDVKSEYTEVQVSSNPLPLSKRTIRNHNRKLIAINKRGLTIVINRNFIDCLIKFT